jgi:hypothetical protein
VNPSQKEYDSKGRKLTPYQRMPPQGGQKQPWRMTAEARAFARQIVNSPEYRASLLRRIVQGALPPQIEAMLWHYSYGKPTEQVQVTVVNELTRLGNDELVRRAQELTTQLQQIELDAVDGPVAPESSTVQ